MALISRRKESDSDTKLYEIKRKDVLPYVGKVSIFILNHPNNKLVADEIEKNLKDNDIEVKRDISEFSTYYDDKINVFDDVRYMVVLVSTEFLHDWSLMGILFDNYDLDGDNSRIIPLIVEDVLYDPMKKSNIVKELQDYSVQYADKYYVKDYDEEAPKELEKMQRIIKMAKDFLNLSLKRDKRSDKLYFKKVIKYIETDLGISLNNEKGTSVEKENTRMERQGGMTNNFYAPVNEVQIQQGNETAIQTQTLKQSDIDYEKVLKIVEEIKKNENKLDDVFGENATKVREILAEVTSLAEQKKEPKKIKDSLLLLKDLSIGIAGSLVASGIVGLISSLNL